MKISADVSSLLAQDRTVRVEHNGQGVVFAITLYKKNNFQEDNETFRTINDYWAQLPERDQQEIYRIYEDIRELFDSITGKDELKKTLMGLVKRLMDFHRVEDVEMWVRLRSGLEIPRSVNRSYTHDVDKATTLDKTYTHADYPGLMALSVLFRAMIPIWAMYNKTTKVDSGKVQKERDSFRLLSESDVYTSEPMKRLTRYISANLNKNSFTGNHTLNFICEDDMPHYLLSLVCVRKLCLGELRSSDTESNQNLAALVYIFVVDRPSPQGSDFANLVNEKKLPEEGGGETTENNGSTLEIYKARASVTVGRLAEMEYAFRHPMAMAMQLCPSDCDLGLVQKHLERAMETVQQLAAHEIQPPVITLAQWVIAPVFPPLGLFHMEQDVVLKALAITETVLRARGFGYLGLLSTSYAIVDGDGMRVTPIGGKTHISQELVERIQKHFPFRQEQRKRAGVGADLCPVTEDIKALSNKFTNFTWRATADEALVQQVLNSRMRRVPILPNLRSDLGEMLCRAEEDLLAAG